MQKTALFNEIIDSNCSVVIIKLGAFVSLKSTKRQSKHRTLLFQFHFISVKTMGSSELWLPVDEIHKSELS